MSSFRVGLLACLCAVRSLSAAAPLPAAPSLDTLPLWQGGPVRPSPTWLTQGIIYQVWLRSFTNEGTLHAAELRLPTVASLGATIVYLSPVTLQDPDPRPEYWSPRQQGSPTRNPRNPYRISNYGLVDPEYGTEDDVRSFISAAHRLGLHVLMDAVFLHTGPTSNLLQHPDYYEHDSAGRIVYTRWNFPKLNFANRQLRQYLIDNLKHWVSADGADGFRCDVAYQIPVDFWEDARRQIEAIHPGLVMLAESTWKPAEQLQAFDASYAFPWYNAVCDVMQAGRPATDLRVVWQKMHDCYPHSARFVHYDGNHDKECADLLFGEQGNEVITLLNFTLDGIPFIYNGQEIGDATPEDLEAHWPIHWAAAGLPRGTEIRRWYTELCRLRANHPVLSAGSTSWLATTLPESILAFTRRDQSGEILVVANVSNRRSTFSVNLDGGHPASWHPLLGSPDDLKADGHNLKLTLPAFGYVVLQ